MNTGAFVTFLQNRINGEYSRAEILEMVNNAQNEILSKECAIVRVIPDPYIHTGSASYTGHTSSNASGAGTFTVNETIAATVPTSGFLLVTETTTTKYEYASYSGTVFTLANGVTLSASYTSAATATVDTYELIASGALFSSVKNQESQNTGSASYTGHATANVSGDGTFVINEVIGSTVPTTGTIRVIEGGTTTSYAYTSYSGSEFTLSGTLSFTYTSAAVALADTSEVTESGSQQWDIRKVQRVYTFSSDDSRYVAYGGADIKSYRPDRQMNSNSYDVEVSVDATESLEPNSKDAKIIFWRENDPGVSTAEFVAEAYRWPDQLSTESVSITIPARFHTNLLYYAVLKDIEYEEYGSADRPMQLYEKYLKEFLDEVNRGATTEQRQTLPNW